MCQTSKTVQNIYSLLPHPAIIKLLDNKNYMRICRKCAERETGKKTIKELHELEKLASGWLNKNKKSNPQNNLPLWTGNLKFSEDVKAGQELNIALWRKVDKFSFESYGIVASINTENKEEKKDAKPEIF